MKMCGAASPVTDNKDGILFKRELFDPGIDKKPFVRPEWEIYYVDDPQDENPWIITKGYVTGEKEPDQ
jgi:hypothetical protein